MMIYFMAGLSGLGLGLLFPKFNLFYLAWVALVPLFWAIYASKTLKQACRGGVITAAIFFGINLYWINTLEAYVSGWIYLGWLALVLLQVFFFGLFVVAVWRGRSFPLKYKLLLFPAAFVGVEWLRSLGSFGITAGGLGYSQVSFLPLIQIAAYTSVAGIGFLIVMVNVLLAEIAFYKKINWVVSAFVVFVLVLIIAFGNSVLNQEPSDSKLPMRVALIQGNVSQKDKLDHSKTNNHFYKYLGLSKKALKEKPNLILWPETAVTAYLLHSPLLRGELAGFVREYGQFLIAGAPTYVDGKAFNSLVLFNPLGYAGKYDKKHLVPFGEYLPLRPLLYPLLKATGLLEMDYSAAKEIYLLEAGEMKIGVAICFESTFPSIVRQRVKQGASLLLVATNDAWFFDSAAAYQHLQSAVFRAVENKTYLLQVANTGISAIIDPKGRVLSKSSLGQEAILTGEVYPLEERSFYSSYGDIFVYACLLVILGFFWFFRKRSPSI